MSRKRQKGERGGTAQAVTERVRTLPAARMFPQETSAANAVFRCGPSGEKVNRKNPQIFPIYN